MSCESATRVGLDSDRYAPSAQPNTDKRNHRKSVTFAWKPSTKVCNFRLPLTSRTIDRILENSCKSEPLLVPKTQVASSGRPAQSSRAWQV